MQGGTGDDAYIVDNVNDEVVEYATEGKDTIKSSVSYDLGSAPNVENLILTGSGADINGYGNTLDNVILGNSGDNRLFGGGNGNEILKGGGGDDQLYGDNQRYNGDGFVTMAGGTDDDYYVVGAGDAVVEHEGEGYDTVETRVDYTLADNVEKLIMTGGSDGKSGTGNELKNVIIGKISTPTSSMAASTPIS